MNQLIRKFPLIVVAALLAYDTSFALEKEELTGLLQEVLEETGVPGLRASVRFDNGRIVSAAVGLADIENQVSLNNDIGMPGGSTGKTFVAALTMLLIEDGVLTVDDPISKWVSDTEWYEDLPNADAITVGQLLSHSSGLGDYPGSVRFNSKMAWRAIRTGSAYFTPEELIGYASGRSGRFAPGEGFSYTDAGYLVLGRVIESATGRSYFDLLRERILEPHGLDDIRAQDVSALPDIAHAYQGGASDLKKDGRMKLDPRTEWTGGGLVTTPAMLAQFLGLLANAEIVSADSLELMTSSGWLGAEESDYHYGFGLFVDNGGEWYGHQGRWAGYRSIVNYFPDHGITIAAQSNRASDINMPSLVRRIAALTESGNE